MESKLALMNTLSGAADLGRHIVLSRGDRTRLHKSTVVWEMAIGDEFRGESEQCRKDNFDVDGHIAIERVNSPCASVEVVFIKPTASSASAKLR